jgi:hypothetical protein
MSAAAPIAMKAAEYARLFLARERPHDISGVHSLCCRFIRGVREEDFELLSDEPGSGFVGRFVSHLVFCVTYLKPRPALSLGAGVLLLVYTLPTVWFERRLLSACVANRALGSGEACVVAIVANMAQHPSLLLLLSGFLL